MIFVTLGSQKFQFDRLLAELDRLIETGIITQPVFAQTGYSTYTPRHFTAQAFLDRDGFSEKMDQAALVITHAGTGAIIGAVKKGKKVIAVPRLSKYGEHVDDHQTQIVAQFNEMELILGLEDTAQLEAALLEIPNRQFQSYQSNTHRIIADIEEFLGG